MIVGPTVFTVTKGNGAPERCTSVNKISCSYGVAPPPPYSVGHPSPRPPSRVPPAPPVLGGPSEPQPAVAAELSHEVAVQRGVVALAAELAPDVRGEHAREVLTQRLLQVPLGRGQLHVLHEP